VNAFKIFYSPSVLTPRDFFLSPQDIFEAKGGRSERFCKYEWL
jgi:hypothetical protein